MFVSRNIVAYDGSAVVLESTYTARQTIVPTASVVTKTSRFPDDELAQSLNESSDALSAAGIISIGDCFAPGTIAAAVCRASARTRIRLAAD